jgi:hypothetical protein
MCDIFDRRYKINILEKAGSSKDDSGVKTGDKEHTVFIIFSIKCMKFIHVLSQSKQNGLFRF